MRSKLLLALAISFPLTLTSYANAAITVDQKAEIMADVINAVTPKTQDNVTVLGARHEQNTVIIDGVVNIKQLENVTDVEFQKITPILNKAFGYGVCSETSQKHFIDEGGIIEYSLKEAASGRLLSFKVESCAG